ncbi:MAG: FAD-dependent oxidoreductase, partial [Albidovulum sp.]
MKTDVLNIGGGLAGLSLARGLHAAGQDFLLLESRSRFGGRIKTENLTGGYYDMG